MIKLNATGACKDCQHIELDLDYIWVGPRKHYTCRCVHQDVCGLIKDEQFPDENKITKIPMDTNGNLLGRALDPDWQKAHMDMGFISPAGEVYKALGYYNSEDDKND